MITSEMRQITLDNMPKDKTIDTVTLEEALECFNQMIKIRNEMGGALYYNITNDQCHVWYDILKHLDAPQEILTECFEQLR